MPKRLRLKLEANRIFPDQFYDKEEFLKDLDYEIGNKKFVPDNIANCNTMMKISGKYKKTVQSFASELAEIDKFIRASGNVNALEELQRKYNDFDEVSFRFRSISTGDKYDAEKMEPLMEPEGEGSTDIVAKDSEQQTSQKLFIPRGGSVLYRAKVYLERS